MESDRHITWGERVNELLKFNTREVSFAYATGTMLNEIDLMLRRLLKKEEN